MVPRFGMRSDNVGCLTSQQHESVSQGRVCLDNFTCCHTEIEVADQIFHLTQSQDTDTGPTSPSTDPITPGAWQGSHWSANFEVTGMTRPRKKIPAQAGFEPGIFSLEADTLTTMPTSGGYEKFGPTEEHESIQTSNSVTYVLVWLLYFVLNIVL